MFYYQIALRQVRDCFTWHSSAELKIGARVQVKFRHQARIGLVVQAVDKPDFKTSEVLSVLDEKFMPAGSLALAQYLAATHFTPVGKVLALMVPEPFWQKVDPIKRRIKYQLAAGFTADVLRHPTQKQFYQHLQLAPELWSDTIPPAFKNTFKTFLKNQWLQAAEEALVPETSLPKPAEAVVPLKLTEAQQGVLDSLLKLKGGALLWGVTGSGKTEVYKHYFNALLEQNADAQFLFLLPEIALTPQLIAQFAGLFPGQVAVWHSNLTAQEKVQAFARLESGQAKILIGTRSAALVPIPNLKAMVVDEEHEWTFKNEFAPRFWTHEIVEYLAARKSMAYLYGSATPKLRTYHQVQSGRLQLLELPERVHKTQLPTIELIDLVQESKRGNFSPLSARLEEAIEQTLAASKQVVLFLNKRGFAGATLCKFCGHTFHCDHCDMALKLHRQHGHERLICHVCGSMKNFPKSCPDCSQADFTLRGWGTQQLEAQLQEKFPQAELFRADRDTITGRYDFEKLMNEFKASKQGILLGTQMIAKGLDFESVALVGIVLADVGLHLPDHHAEERVYQLLEQVSGRAGRRHTQGHIVVQTYQREAPLFGYLQQHDTKGFMAAKHEEHQRLGLPPFSDVVKITCVDTSKATAFATCKTLHQQLTQTLKQQQLDQTITARWAPAFFPRLHGKYWFYVFLQSADNAALQQLVQQYAWPEGVRVDVSPVSLI